MKCKVVPATALVVRSHANPGERQIARSNPKAHAACKLPGVINASDLATRCGVSEPQTRATATHRPPGVATLRTTLGWIFLPELWDLAGLDCRLLPRVALLRRFDLTAFAREKRRMLLFMGHHRFRTCHRQRQSPVRHVRSCSARTRQLIFAVSFRRPRSPLRQEHSLSCDRLGVRIPLQ